MREISAGHFYGNLRNKIEHYPLHGQIELTYHCNLNCVHCYCKGLEDRDKELNTLQWKKILDEIQREGCVYLTFTGGEPLIREDFLELYFYAKRKCFLITILTNGQLLTRDILKYLTKSPPYSVEITLNGIKEETYEAITQIKGSFSKVIKNIRNIKQKRLPLILKSNCLKQNKNEIVKIKAFVEKFLGKVNGKGHFKYDPMIYPRLNGNKSPIDFRLSFEELLELRRQDIDIWQEYERGLNADFPSFGRNRDFLYRCNSWMTNFFINPYGRLKFCNISEKFSIDLKETAFKDGFYKAFPKLWNEKFKTNSKCRDCHLRAICNHCPARTYLETGDEEAPVEYYCRLAKESAKLRRERQEKLGK